MISSSKPHIERGLDTMVLVYSVLPGHPAAAACERFLRANAGGFTSPSVLFEAKNVLTKVYREDPLAATQKLVQIANGPPFSSSPLDIGAMPPKIPSGAARCRCQPFASRRRQQPANKASRRA